jgi:hypothetical protein
MSRKKDQRCKEQHASFFSLSCLDLSLRRSRRKSVKLLGWSWRRPCPKRTRMSLDGIILRKSGGTNISKSTLSTGASNVGQASQKFATPCNGKRPDPMIFFSQSSRLMDRVTYFAFTRIRRLESIFCIGKGTKIYFMAQWVAILKNELEKRLAGSASETNTTREL